MLAEKYHYHFDYLNRQFTKWTDKTIFHYLNTVRGTCQTVIDDGASIPWRRLRHRQAFVMSIILAAYLRNIPGITPGQVREE